MSIRIPLWLAAHALVSCAWASPAQSILNAKCVGCHGASRMAGLDLRDRASALKGGARGPAIMPGKPEASLLYQAVKGDGPVKMPPGNASLTATETKAIADWIRAGAPFEAGGARGESWWSFRKVVRPPVPASEANPIDSFLRAKLREKGIAPAPEADKRALIRRAYLDLTGLPPSPEEVDRFDADPDPAAWDKLIGRLLESPRYGERQGRYWLDLVRYADTAGFETDHFYLTAWRYRDYVIKAFNDDKPYDTFIREQIAADEIWSTDMDLEGTLELPKKKAENVYRRIGTSLFTIGSFPIESTYYGDQYRAEWQADAVDTIGAAFLGLTVGCARCHDHKFDPLSQRDYYRLTAMFAGSVEREIPLVSLFDVQTASRGFPLLAHAQAYKQMAGKAKRGSEARAELARKTGEAWMQAPERYPTAIVLAHEEQVRDTHVLGKGDFRAKGEKVDPGFPAALGPGPEIVEPKGFLFVPRRRKALAEWLSSPEHPLTARVMVNRIWQGHFGDGIVRTPNDFGRQGDAPTHPELLDWLASEFVAQGWSVKKMHRLIMTSAAYRASSVAAPGAAAKDPENRYLSHMTRRRLDGDSIRDSILAVAGTLNLKMGGVGIIPPLSKEEMQAARMPNLWPAHPDPAEHHRRSIYLQMKRSLTLPMLQAFDAPDPASSCARRERSTVAPQALALLNSEFTAAQSAKFAERARKAAGSDEPEAMVRAAWRIALSRPPRPDELATAAAYLRRNGAENLCLLLLNLNEFVYAD